MNVNQEVRLNLSADGIPPRLFMPQGDANSRTIIATLWDGATPYNVPASTAVMVRFRKPDGTGGLYDATEAGTAVTASGNTVTAPVATQMLAVAGVVQAEIDIYGPGSGTAADRLATFRFAAGAAPRVYPDAQIISSDYFNLIAATISEAIDAAAKADLAKTAAQAAQSAAETAQSGAESAEQGAQAAQAAAENAKTAAQTAQQGAKAAQDAAEDAQAAAEGAKSGAQAAQQGAQAAQQGAQTAQQGAEAAQQGAEAAQDAAEDAQAAAASSAAAAAASAANAATSVEGAVKYNTPQSLTDAQKQQARDNINASAPYEAGDNIAITGRIITTKAFPCNPNLLDNWYFGNPVNQRGASGTISTAGYFFDRWKLVSGSVTINSGGIVLNGTIAQVLEYAVGQTVTATVLTPDGVTDVTPVYDDETKTFMVTTQGKTILAAKLELGSQQTLAHQENGVWELNEIPDYGEQLRRCQRYTVRIGKAGTYQILGTGVAPNANICGLVVPLPVEMRTIPVATLNGRIVLTNAAGVNIYCTNVTVSALGVGAIELACTASGLSPSAAYTAYIEAGNYLLLSADL